MAYKFRRLRIGRIEAAGAALTPDNLRIDDSTAKSVLGFALSSDRTDQVFYRGEFGLDLSNNTLWPNGWPARVLLLGGSTVPPNERFNSEHGPLDPGNGIITLRYQDVPSASLGFVAYNLDLLIKYEV